MRGLVEQLEREGLKASRAAIGDAFKAAAGEDPELGARLEAPRARGPASGGALPSVVVDDDMTDAWTAVAEEGLELLRLAFNDIRERIASKTANDKDFRLLLDGAERAAKIAGALQARVAPAPAADEDDGGPRPEVVELDGEFLERLRAFDARAGGAPAPPSALSLPAAPSA